MEEANDSAYRVNPPVRLLRFAIRKPRRGLPTLSYAVPYGCTSVRKTDFYMQSQGLTDIEKEIVKIFGVCVAADFRARTQRHIDDAVGRSGCKFFDKIDETDQ